jgi:hypothetical protein
MVYPTDTPAGLIDSPVVTKTIQYTSTELLKIYISGAILVIAVLLITYYLYKYANAWYARRLQKAEMEERAAKGFVTRIEELPPVAVGINKNIFLVIGLAIILIGIVQMAM